MFDKKGFEKAVEMLEKGEEKGMFVWAPRLKDWLFEESIEGIWENGRFSLVVSSTYPFLRVRFIVGTFEKEVMEKIQIDASARGIT